MNEDSQLLSGFYLLLPYDAGVVVLVAVTHQFSLQVDCVAEKTTSLFAAAAVNYASIIFIGRSETSWYQ